jgi:hypothetical protein
VFNATFCVIMVLGVILVAKPTFIFGSTPSLESNVTTDNITDSSYYNGTVIDQNIETNK